MYLRNVGKSMTVPLEGGEAWSATRMLTKQALVPGTQVPSNHITAQCTEYVLFTPEVVSRWTFSSTSFVSSKGTHAI